MLEPRLVICDEPVSALDVSVRAQALNLLEDLKQRHGLSLLFIAHDLAVVKSISDRIAAMYLGKLCEVAPSECLYADPAHPYTKVLIDANPGARPDRPAATAGGRRPAVGRVSSHRTARRLSLRARCPRATANCAEAEPQLTHGRDRRRSRPLCRLPPSPPMTPC